MNAIVGLVQREGSCVTTMHVAVVGGWVAK